MWFFSWAHCSVNPCRHPLLRKKGEWLWGGQVAASAAVTGFTSRSEWAYHLGVMVRPRKTAKPRNKLPWSVQSKNNSYRACVCCEVRHVSPYPCISISLWCGVLFSYGCCSITTNSVAWDNRNLFFYSSEGQKSKVNFTALKSGVGRAVLSGGSRGESISCHR